MESIFPTCCSCLSPAHDITFHRNISKTFRGEIDTNINGEFNEAKEGESSTAGGMISSMQPESFEGDSIVKSWIQRQLYGEMSQEYNFQESEFAAAVSAATFAIRSLDEEEEMNYRRKKREEYERTKTRNKTIKEDDAMDGSLTITRSFSSKEVKDKGETSSRKTTQQDQRVQEKASVFPVRKPNRSSSFRLTNPVADRTRTRNSTGRDVKESKVETWEKEKLRKINKWYEKMKSQIFKWENAKKMQAKLSMEKKKNELELRRARNFQHYQNKVSRIDMVSGGARAQLEEKRRNQESDVKEKAKFMRSKGRSTPVKYFCW